MGNCTKTVFLEVKILYDCIIDRKIQSNSEKNRVFRRKIKATIEILRLKSNFT